MHSGTPHRHEFRSAEDALNDYLDSRTGRAGPGSHSWDSERRDDVDAFFDLARRAGVGVPSEGRSPMQHAVSLNHSEIETSVSGTEPFPLTSRIGWRSGQRAPSPWVSVAVVVLLLLGTVGGAWWFGPGRGGDDPIQLAALVNDEGTPEAFWPDPLNPVDDPWVAAILPEECTAEPMPYEEFAAAKTTDPGPPTGSFEVVGVPNAEDAEAVVKTLRGWTACYETGNPGKIRAYVTDEYLFFSDVSVDNQKYQGVLEARIVESGRAFTEWARITDYFPMSIIEGVEPPTGAAESFSFAQELLDAGTGVPIESPRGGMVYSDQGVPNVFFEGRFSPEDAVLLADDRIMVPLRYVYWAEDPWFQAYGLSTQPNLIITSMVLENVGGEWLIDEAVHNVCIGACQGVFEGAGATPTMQPVATPES